MCRIKPRTQVIFITRSTNHVFINKGTSDIKINYLPKPLTDIKTCRIAFLQLIKTNILASNLQTGKMYGLPFERLSPSMPYCCDIPEVSGMKRAFNQGPRYGETYALTRKTTFIGRIAVRETVSAS